MPIKRRPEAPLSASPSGSASQKAVERLRSEGLQLPVRPDDGVPRLPRDLSEISDTVLMDLLARYTEWSSFLGTGYTRADIDEAEAENMMETLGAQIMVANWKGGSADRVALAKAHRETDPEYLKARTVFAETKAYRKMLERLYLNVENEKGAVSREITRRVGREPVERRNRRFNP